MVLKRSSTPPTTSASPTTGTEAELKKKSMPVYSVLLYRLMVTTLTFSGSGSGL